MIHEQIELASKSLRRRRKFNEGWYDKRIACLEEVMQAFIEEVDSWGGESAILTTKTQQLFADMKTTLYKEEEDAKKWTES